MINALEQRNCPFNSTPLVGIACTTNNTVKDFPTGHSGGWREDAFLVRVLFRALFPFFFVPIHKQRGASPSLPSFGCQQPKLTHDLLFLPPQLTQLPLNGRSRRPSLILRLFPWRLSLSLLL